MKRIGLVGARGHAGGEFLGLVAKHEGLSLGYVASRSKAGEPANALCSDLDADLAIVAPTPEGAAAAGLDACVLALPNGEAAPYVAAFERASSHTVIVDFSADYRFDDAWAYGLPELNREVLRRAARIANPGCYATAVQLAVAPFKDRLAGAVAAFAVSGYSGAGSTPGPRNDAERLHDSVMPYGAVGHLHEREIRRNLGLDVNFTPAVAGFFRGILATVQAPLTEPMTADDVAAELGRAYGAEPLISVSRDLPELRDGRGVHGAVVGGTAAPDERRVVVACALDNLLKGAASQALQNVNLALGFDELAGLDAGA